MANLGTWVFNENEYTNVETKTGLTFQEDTTYTIQIQDIAYIREGATGKGFYCFNREPILYTHKGNDLYIKADNALVNIAD